MTRAVTLAGYAVLLAAVVVLELRARRRGGTTFARAVAILLRSPLTRLALQAAWLWLGWHLFVRVGR